MDQVGSAFIKNCLFFSHSEEDLTVAHHADPASSVANLSHVILYQPGDRMEPEMKYNMKHIKTLPVSWIVNCINSGAIVEP